jgi:hypothetical protein
MGEQGSSLPSFPWGNKGVTGASFPCFHNQRGGDRTKLGAGGMTVGHGRVRVDFWQRGQVGVADR